MLHPHHIWIIVAFIPPYGSSTPYEKNIYINIPAKPMYFINVMKIINPHGIDVSSPCQQSFVCQMSFLVDFPPPNPPISPSQRQVFAASLLLHCGQFLSRQAARQLGRFRDLNWRYLPSFLGEYTHKLWPLLALQEIWYSTWNSHWANWPMTNSPVACSNPPLGRARSKHIHFGGYQPLSKQNQQQVPQKNVKNHVTRWSKAIRFRAVPQDLQTSSHKSRGNPKRVMAMSSSPLDFGNVDLIHRHLNLICFA